MRLILPSGIHFLTAILAGRQTNPKMISATKGLRKAAIAKLTKGDYT